MHSKSLNKWVLIVVGTVTWSLTMVKSGLIYSFGMGFWGPNGHDGIWHLALAGSLSRFTLDMPTFTGLPVQNYHIGFDLFLALLHLVTRIPLSILYFQILPPIFALSIGFLTYQFVMLWKKDTSTAWWSTFFVYFGGSWAWIIKAGESHFWSQQAISTLINPPFALSIIVLLLSLISLTKNRLVSSIILFAILPQIKVYAGVLAFAGLFLSCIKNKAYLKILIPSAILAALIYMPLNSSSSGLIVFRPLWFLQNLFTADRLNWPQMYSALQTYYSGHAYLKGFLAYSLSLAVFLIGNLGTRIISLKSLKLKTWVDYFFLAIIILGIAFPMLFLQKGTAWNTIQFFYYTSFVLALYSGVAIARFSVPLRVIMAIITLPTTYFSLHHYLPTRPPAKISHQELEALSFLSRQPKGIVYTSPFDKDKADAQVDHPPRPLYLYESTAYVSAFSNKPVFLEDTVNLNITGYDWSSRLRDPESSDNITYYYLTSDKPYPNTHLIYSNSEIYIYKSDL